MATMDLIMLFFFEESSGQTPGNFEGQNTSGNLKGRQQNFQSIINS